MLSFSFCLSSPLYLAGIYVTTTGLLLGTLLTLLAVGSFMYAAKFYFNTRQPEAEDSALTRKFEEVQIEPHRRTFFYVGTVASLMLVLLVMNWTTFNRYVSVAAELGEPEVMQLEIPNTATPVAPPPPAPKILHFFDDVKLTDKEIIEKTEEPVKKPEDNQPIGEGNAESKGILDGGKEGGTGTTPLPEIIPEKEPSNDKEIFSVVESMPHLVQCEGDKKAQQSCTNQTLLTYLPSKMRYPSEAKELGIEGTVIVSFVVETNGELTDIKVVKEIGGGCGDEALRVVKMLSKEYQWVSGQQRGRNVRVKFNLPVKFKLK